MKKLRNIMVVFLLLMAAISIALGVAYNYYSKPVSDNTELKEINIPENTTGNKIGEILKENNIIRSDIFWKFYLKVHNISGLNFGTYKFSESMTVEEIVDMLKEKNTDNNEEISITFPEGINMRQIARIIEKNTNNTYDDVMNFQKDSDYLHELIENYWFITEDILDKDIYYPLEGYLYPDTYFFKNKDVSVKDIFNKLIKQMDIVLLPYKDDIESNKYSVHELLTLSSIAELEVNKSSDRPKVVSVFMNRLDKKMSLGSDITTRYSIKLDDKRALTAKEYASVNAYNTRSSSLAGKLPAGPIGTISKECILASLNAPRTDYLYFISNIKTGETFFYKNSSDFEKKKAELKSVNGGY